MFFTGNHVFYSVLLYIHNRARFYLAVAFHLIASGESLLMLCYGVSKMQHEIVETERSLERSLLLKKISGINRRPQGLLLTIELSINWPKRQWPICTAAAISWQLWHGSASLYLKNETKMHAVGIRQTSQALLQYFQKIIC